MRAAKLYFSVRDWARAAMVRAGLAEPNEKRFPREALGVAREAIELGEAAKKFIGSDYEAALIEYMEMQAQMLLGELESKELSGDGYLSGIKVLRDIAAWPYTLLAQAKESQDQIADWREQGLAVDGPLAAGADEPEA